MAKVRLRHNVIVGNKHIARGSIIDENVLTENLRNIPEIVNRDLDHKEGKVMLLIGITYTTDQIDHSTG